MTAIDLPIPPPASARLELDTAVPALESPRPVVHPAMDALGRTITDFRPDDHPWHHGLSLALPVVRADDGPIVSFWGGPTFVRGGGYQQLDNVGRQRVVEHGVDASGARLRVQWQDAAGRPLLDETRVYSTRAVGPTAWALDVSSRWTALASLRFGSPGTEGRPDGGYGGFFLRAHPRFVGAEVVANGRGTTEDSLRGERARWAGLRAPGQGAALLVARDPSPEVWFVRSTETPMLCAAPFFHEELRLDAGTSRDWRWSLVSVADDLNLDELDEVARA
ncbi:DUF6807 family protein [Schumannella luteola]